MSKNFHYVKVDSFVPSEVCDFLIENYGKWSTAKTLDPDYSSQRSSDIAWIVDNFWKTSFFKIIDDINAQSFEFNINSVEDLQLTKYVAPNGHYDYHLDGTGYSAMKGGLVRKLSMSVLLNDDFDGGEFEYQIDTKSLTVKLKKGDVLVFPSYFLHRVKPVTMGTRYSLVAWASGEQLK